MSCTVPGIGLAGFGTVGSGVWNMLKENGGLISSRSQDAIQLKIRKICVHDLEKARDGHATADLFTTDLRKNMPSIATGLTKQREAYPGTSSPKPPTPAVLRPLRPAKKSHSQTSS